MNIHEYRAWDPKNKVIWYDGLLISQETNTCWLPIYTDDADIVDLEECFNFITMEYSGFNDRAGNKAYEGDLFSVDKETCWIWQVERSENDGKFYLFTPSKFNKNIRPDIPISDVTTMTRIGNIYEDIKTQKGEGL